jgi:hypothetical protein
VHIPESLLTSIDRIVKERGVSRNRFIIQACQKAIENDAGRWPDNFFDSSLNPDDKKLLRKGTAEMEQVIYSKRKNRLQTDL